MRMGRTPCEDGGRDHGDASTSRGTPKIVGTTRRYEKVMEQEHGPADTLISNSSFQNFERIDLLFKANQYMIMCKVALGN